MSPACVLGTFSAFRGEDLWPVLGRGWTLPHLLSEQGAALPSSVPQMA